MKQSDVCTKKIYKQGAYDKTAWLRVGTLVQFDDGKQQLELNMFPNEKFYVFEQKPKGTQNEDQIAAQNPPIDSVEANVGIEDLPF